MQADPLIDTFHEFAKIYPIEAGKRLLICLPLAHLPQRMLLYGSLLYRLDLVLGQPANFLRDAVVFSPNLFVLVPKLVEFLYQCVKKTGSLEAVFARGCGSTEVCVSDAEQVSGWAMCDATMAGQPVLLSAHESAQATVRTG